MSDFPELQGDAQNGKTKMWSIRVFERNGTGVIETTYGYVDGKKQVNEKVIAEGKNVGKKNETTPLQQAISEARSAWIKKKESGYAPKGAAAATSAVATESSDEEAEAEAEAEAVPEVGRGKGIDSSVPSPMLAHDYNKRGKSIQFPCYVQRKFDGTRCVGISQKGLYSRNRKAYPHLDHIVEELSRLPPTLILDGELYSNTLTFQEIVGLVKRETLKKGDEEKQKQIQFHIYDIINDKPYEQRLAALQYLFSQCKFHNMWQRAMRASCCEIRMEPTRVFDRLIFRNIKNSMTTNTRSLITKREKARKQVVSSGSVKRRRARSSIVARGARERSVFSSSKRVSITLVRS